MNCPRCYNPNVPDTAANCPQCGAPLDQTAMQYGRLCPSGKHQMDPTWTTCAFCKAESASFGSDNARATVAEPARVPTGPIVGHSTVADPAIAPPPVPGGRKTVIDGMMTDLRNGGLQPPATPPARRQAKTVFGVQLPEAGASSASAAVSPTMHPPVALPRIVAVLVTYSIQSEGMIFPVREGRNKIGADPDAEISIQQDRTISGWNTSVTFRDGKFWLSAKDSMNGTYLNGTEVPPDSTTALPNYATIRAGSTSFRFIMIEPGETPAAAQ